VTAGEAEVAVGPAELLPPQPEHDAKAISKNKWVFQFPVAHFIFSLQQYMSARRTKSNVGLTPRVLAEELGDENEIPLCVML
jgi:hypothetical protein